MPIIDPDPGRLYETYRATIGGRRRDLPTPALILDIEAATRNLQAMERALRGQPARLRPHIKAEKSPRLAALHIEHGAVGVATATAWEALAMAETGIADVLIANEVVGPAKLDAVVAAAPAEPDHDRDRRSARGRRTVGRGPAGGRRGRGADRGRRRHGARRHPQRRGVAGGRPGRGGGAGDQAARRAGLRGSLHVRDRSHRPDGDGPRGDGRRRRARAALREAGHLVTDVSGGGTGTYDITGRNPIVTELQAGSFVFMDRFHAPLVDQFEFALFVASTVVARHGRTIVLDAGRKSVGIDYASPRIAGIDMDGSGSSPRSTARSTSPTTRRSTAATGSS